MRILTAIRVESRMAELLSHGPKTWSILVSPGDRVGGAVCPSASLHLCAVFAARADSPTSPDAHPSRFHRAACHS